ncbi:fasciclin domain-containing protein [Echinicola salinicaeni]|uniref:fasciclin domain-containing protein n=1 Tax=Echinicola salinicaeni TaxID=2762757 RepID=UPI0016451B94|nr:fasciclin domain-containing protein [Echinicola salinicaeni]
MSLLQFRNSNLKIFMIALFSVIAFTACQETEDISPDTNNDFPNLIQALSDFDGEYEYLEDDGNDADARKGPTKYLRKPTFFTLTAALKYTGLFPTVAKNKLTLFAPDDKAFADMGLNFMNIKELPKDVLTDILLYHAAEGFTFSNKLPACSLEMMNGSSIGFNFMDGMVYIKDGTEDPAKVVFTDKRAINSIFHGIDKVLLPPDMNIAEIASGNDDFETLVFLLIETDLVGVFADETTNNTVFAPTDMAFENLEADNPGITAYLLDNPNELTKVLLHHVSPGSTFSFCLSDGMMIPTLNKDYLTFKAGGLILQSSSGNEVGLIGDLLDIHAKNGVIHAIDYILVPENLELPG